MNNSQTPLSYTDWINTKGFASDISQEAYLAYLNSWYGLNDKLYHNNDKNLKKRQEYIQLIKDLLVLLDPKEKQDLFLTDIDFNNDEDLMYIIPYLASKLKQISQIIVEKREEIKKSKTKHEMIGSNQALEKILYEYVLKNFTKKPYSWTRVPVLSLQNQFPELSAINEDFYIEIEELYDTNNYHDSDPSVPISEYLDINSLLTKEPFSSLSVEELTGLITSRLLLRVADTPLSNVFNQYLSYSSVLSSSALSSYKENYKTSVFNQIAANQTYLGEDLYGLTAIKLGDVNQPDYRLRLNITNGNNWFYWPSGDKGPDVSSLGNIYAPIPINQSNLLLGRSVTGSNHTDSDLIFTKKDGILYGAWLQGYRNETSHDVMKVKLYSNDTTSFIFPWVGFNISSKDLSFGTYRLDDSNDVLFQKLDPNIRKNILNGYYSSMLPNSSSFDMYLNQTTLINLSANAGYTYDDADNITITPAPSNVLSWSDELFGVVKQAYLYKFDTTDIYIPVGVTDIHWPIESYTSGTDNLTLTLSSDTCLPVALASIDPAKTMVGSIAGNSYNTSDVIYKFASNGSTPVEAAWLGSGSLTNLNQLKNAIPVYQTSAVNCAQYIDGAIQSSLCMVMEPGKYNSFIWMDEDTSADKVFNYHQHSADCPYNASYPHDFYTNQDYQNPTPLNQSKLYPLNQHPCTCGAVNRSPIGTQGKRPDEYNNMADLLFADPQGLGVDFNYKGWKDTRDFDAYTSPQFSFFQIDGNLDTDVGFGNGTWVNGNGTPMILKTGRRYAYYRSNLRINSNSPNMAPYLFVKYPYKNINVNCGLDFSGNTDLVILIDNSRTQKFNIDMVKNMAKTICNIAMTTSTNTLISIIYFDENGLVLNYLTDSLSSMIKSINSISTPPRYPEWLTNIVDGLTLANNVLTVNQPYDYDCKAYNINDLCKNLQSKVINYSNIPTITNCPRKDANKKIIIFSDGQETVNEGYAVPYANLIKKDDITIFGIDIGYYGLKDTVVKQIASPNYYYNLQQYLLYTDVNLDRFIQILATLVIGCFPSIPIWCKATRDADGNWKGINVPSDMFLYPGDYLGYVHQNSVSYLGQSPNTNFTVPAVSFTINIKLDGWDYETSHFSIDNSGDKFGAKPFWGAINPSLTSLPIGGGGRMMDDYVILHQPLVSDIILSNGNYIRYQNYGRLPIEWKQPLTFNVRLTSQQWNKLNIKKTDSIYSSELTTKSISDYIVESTNEPSDLVLESYSTLNPSKYDYYLSPVNKPFTYIQPLYYINRCNETFVTFTSSKILDALNAHMNLDNIHYPTIANISFPSDTISERELGSYLLPNKLGVSYYRGKGYDISLDPTSVSFFESNSAELVFSGLDKYGSRNRGLTKKDQMSPIKINNVDNRWMFEPYSSGNYSGTIIDTKVNQKMIPYQSNYEINPMNQIGISLQKDNFEFWSVDFYNLWTDKQMYPLTFRNELIFDNFLNRTEALLCDKGNQQNWRTDIFGNNFTLFKYYDYSKTYYLTTEDGDIITSELGLKIEIQ